MTQRWSNSSNNEAFQGFPPIINSKTTDKYSNNGRLLFRSSNVRFDEAETEILAGHLLISDIDDHRLRSQARLDLLQSESPAKKLQIKQQSHRNVYAAIPIKEDESDECEDDESGIISSRLPDRGIVIRETAQQKTNRLESQRDFNRMRDSDVPVTPQYSMRDEVESCIKTNANSNYKYNAILRRNAVSHGRQRLLNVIHSHTIQEKVIRVDEDCAHMSKAVQSSVAAHRMKKYLQTHGSNVPFFLQSITSDAVSSSYV